MEERFTIDYKIKLAKCDNKMYKLIIFFLNYNALEDISQCRFHEYELQQQTSSQYTVNTFVDFSGG